MLRMLLITAMALVWTIGAGEGIATAQDVPPRYNYWLSDEYAALSKQDRDRVDQVNHDLILLWGAIDIYAEEHQGQVPRKLDHLVPGYLDRLPEDPFATDETAARESWYEKSLGGRGYEYHPGKGRAYVLRSVGLPKFPYRRRAGGGFVQSRGYWRNGRQLRFDVF